MDRILKIVDSPDKVTERNAEATEGKAPATDRWQSDEVTERKAEATEGRVEVTIEQPISWIEPPKSWIESSKSWIELPKSWIAPTK